MPITIKIKEKTLAKLKQLKIEKKLNSYDEVIEALIQNDLNLPKSLLGFMKQKTSSFTRDLEDKDHEILGKQSMSI